MPLLPEWLVKGIIKQMGGFIFDSIIKMSQNFGGSPWEKQMQEDKGNPFYPWLHQRMEKWHELNRLKQNTKM